MSEKRERERERGNVLLPILVTLDVSHFERSPLNTEAPKNAIYKRNKKIKSYKEKKGSKENYFVNKRFIINIRCR